MRELFGALRGCELLKATLSNGRIGAMPSLPEGLTCPICHSTDNAAWDGELWYCEACDGEDPVTLSYEVATLVREEA